MKNNKKTLNIILAGIMATVGLGIWLMVAFGISGKAMYEDPEGEPTLDQLIKLNPDTAGIFIALLSVAIIAWLIRFIIVSVPAYKTGIKGNNVSMLVFDIISIVMLLGVILSVLIPIGQPYYAVFGNNSALHLKPNEYYYMLINMPAYSSALITGSALISAFMYHKAEKKYNQINTISFGLTSMISFSFLWAMMYMVELMYVGKQVDAGEIQVIDWRVGGLALALLLIALIAQILRFALVSIPAIKKGGAKGSNAAILTFDIISIALLLALLIAVFLPLGPVPSRTPTPAEIEAYQNKMIAAENILFYAPGMITISTLISGLVSNQQSK